MSYFDKKGGLANLVLGWCTPAHYPIGPLKKQKEDQMKLISVLPLLLQGVSPTLTPVLFLAVACGFLLLALMLVLLAFFPELADGISLILDAALHSEYRKRTSRFGRRPHKHLRGN